MKKIFLYSLFWLCLDQGIKKLITISIGLGESVTMIPSLFGFTHVRNTGAAWSMLEGNRIFLILVSFVAIGLVYWFMIKDKKIEPIEEIGYGILLGGILGNLIDRVILGYVIDFISIYIGSYAFPIFNVADIGIVIGTLIIVGIMLKEDMHGDNSSRERHK